MKKLTNSDKEFVVIYTRAGATVSAIWTFTNKTTRFQAKKALKRIIARYKASHSEDVKNWSENYLAQNGSLPETEEQLWSWFKDYVGHSKGDESGTFQLMRWHEWEKFEVDQWCSDPIKIISEEEWYEMLEVLPPESWGTRNGVNSFNMCERTTGSITSQYARAEIDGEVVCGTKSVCVYDRDTWINIEGLEKSFRSLGE